MRFDLQGSFEMLKFFAADVEFLHLFCRALNFQIRRLTHINLAVELRVHISLKQGHFQKSRVTWVDFELLQVLKLLPVSVSVLYGECQFTV